METRRVERRLAAVLAADVAGYSRLVGVDEEGTLARLRSLRMDVIDPAVATHGGRIINTAGDGILLEFASVVDAGRCALALQRGVAEHEAGIAPDRRIAFRIGIHVGDVVVEGADLLGRHAHPEVTMHTHPLADYMRPIEAGRWDEAAEIVLS